MQKSGKKQRDIKFKSEKNGGIQLVHSQQARQFAQMLEQDPLVARYVTGKEMDPIRLQQIQKTDIRGAYFQEQWESDFFIIYEDGTMAVREMIALENLEKMPEIEKLELSRRYWQSCGVTDWKVVVGG